MAEKYSNGYKTLWEKGKLLVSSNFSFSHNVFKRLILQTRKNQGLFGKRLKNPTCTHKLCQLTVLILKSVLPWASSSFGLFVFWPARNINFCVFIFFKLLISYNGSLDKCHTSSINTLIIVWFRARKIHVRSSLFALVTLKPRAFKASSDSKCTSSVSMQELRKSIYK